MAKGAKYDGGRDEEGLWAMGGVSMDIAGHGLEGGQGSDVWY